jgi:hypothetical protein
MHIVVSHAVPPFVPWQGHQPTSSGWLAGFLGATLVLILLDVSALCDM